ncbi:MAG: transcriptional repressor LexA [Thermodesulfobacteriota bacterium]
MTRGLTARQAQVLDFIQEFTSGHGYPPTVREVAANFGFRSPRAAHDHMKALEKKGFMRSRAGRPRALEVLHSRRGIPVLGKIAAGQPILAVEEAEELLGLEPTFFGQGRFFALRVRGDSMIGDHITEGDLVILRAQEQARSGQVAAVLIGDEVTLKRVVPGKQGLELRSANPAVPSIFLGPEDEAPRILGVMVGLVRKN